MDVIKTRLQVDGARKYLNAMDVVKVTLREEGARAFTQGMTARVLWIAPGTAITIALYEQFKNFFR